MSAEFSQVLDKACGQMVGLGLKREAMVWLADELACMLSNDSFETQPAVPHSQALYRLMVAIACHLEGRRPSDDGPTEEARPSLPTIPLRLAPTP
jgi:hypothetical protein